MRRWSLAITFVTAALTTAAACGSDANSSGSSGPAATCSKDDLPLKKAGTLTVATDSPTFPPWVEDDDPASGKGFESAVAYALADQLGLTKDQVTWIRVPFNNVFAPGPKDFDFDINQISVTDERKQTVDFSDGYYDVNQAVVAFADSPAAGAATVADLKDLKFGAQVGTTSLDFIDEVIKPDAEPFVYNDNNGAKAALEAKQIDAIVLDAPTAFFVSSVEIGGSEILGKFPTVGDDPEHFGLAFEKGNPLVGCVNEALGTLKSDGTLAELQEQWLPDAGVPEISLG